MPSIMHYSCDRWSSFSNILNSSIAIGYARQSVIKVTIDYETTLGKPSARQSLGFQNHPKHGGERIFQHRVTIWSFLTDREYDFKDVTFCSLAGLLAKELRADLLVLMTDVEGLYTGLPNDPDSSVIPTYCPELHDSLIEYGSSSHGGRGGMVAKVGLHLFQKLFSEPRLRTLHTVHRN